MTKERQGCQPSAGTRCPLDTGPSARAPRYRSGGPREAVLPTLRGDDKKNPATRPLVRNVGEEVGPEGQIPNFIRPERACGRGPERLWDPLTADHPSTQRSVVAVSQGTDVERGPTSAPLEAGHGGGDDEGGSMTEGLAARGEAHIGPRNELGFRTRRTEDADAGDQGLGRSPRPAGAPRPRLRQHWLKSPDGPHGRPGSLDQQHTWGHAGHTLLLVQWAAPRHGWIAQPAQASSARTMPSECSLRWPGMPTAGHAVALPPRGDDKLPEGPAHMRVSRSQQDWTRTGDKRQGRARLGATASPTNRTPETAPAAPGPPGLRLPTLHATP